MRPARPALWIIGVIILALGIIDIIIEFVSKGGYDNLACGFAVLLFLAGLIMTIVGLAKYISAINHNKAFLHKYHNTIFITTCFHCGHEVECFAEDFSVHRNYPEGYIYCPVCHKPLSIRAFKTYN